jgi:hypothetical protein
MRKGNLDSSNLSVVEQVSDSLRPANFYVPLHPTR